MKKIFLALLVFLGLVSITSANEERILECAIAYKKVLRDKKIPAKELIELSHAILVFPSLVKAGLLIGGTGGLGVMLEKDGEGWRASGVQLGGANYGYQIGFESNEAVMFVKDKKIIDDIKQSKFSITQHLAASFGGHSANANSLYTISIDQPIEAYTSNQGVYLGENLGGVVISPSIEEFRTSSYGYKELVNAIENSKIR